MQVSIEPATLYVIATPIGNLEDLGDRARGILAQVALVAAEDTRHTRPMLRHFSIGTPLVPLHEHNERAQTPELVERMQSGESIALVCDAGTPLVSDPGYTLVRAAHDAGLRVSPVPGPSAVIAALSVCGLPTDRFTFEGFLPAKAAARRRVLESLEREPRTLVFFEAVHRIRETLADMAALIGADRDACIARELTKLHETLRTGTLGELADWAASDPDVIKGEVVLVVAGNPAPEAAVALDGFALAQELATELPASRAAALAARLSGIPRKRLYQHLLDQAPGV